MAAKKNASPVGTVMKWAVIIFVLIVAVGWVKNLIAPKVTDVTAMVNMEKTDLQRVLGVSFTNNPDMVKKIYEYSDGEITVDSADGIAVVYIDGQRKGLHIDNRKCGMYGLRIGDAVINVEDKTTYDFDDSFGVLNDEGVGQSTAVHYYNEKKNDCLIVIYNDTSNRVVALTYYNDYRKATEQLSKVW